MVLRFSASFLSRTFAECPEDQVFVQAKCDRNSFRIVMFARKRTIDRYPEHPLIHLPAFIFFDENELSFAITIVRAEKIDSFFAHSRFRHCSCWKELIVGPAG